MSVLLRLKNLPWSANPADVRYFFEGLHIPEGGVHIIGGEEGDAFIAFANEEDAFLALRRDGEKIKNKRVWLAPSNHEDLRHMLSLIRHERVFEGPDDIAEQLRFRDFERPFGSPPRRSVERLRSMSPERYRGLPPIRHHSQSPPWCRDIFMHPRYDSPPRLDRNRDDIFMHSRHISPLRFDHNRDDIFMHPRHDSPSRLDHNRDIFIHPRHDSPSRLDHNRKDIFMHPRHNSPSRLDRRSFPSERKNYEQRNFEDRRVSEVRHRDSVEELPGTYKTRDTARHLSPGHKPEPEVKFVNSFQDRQSPVAPQIHADMPLRERSPDPNSRTEKITRPRNPEHFEPDFVSDNSFQKSRERRYNSPPHHRRISPVDNERPRKVVRKSPEPLAKAVEERLLEKDGLTKEGERKFLREDATAQEQSNSRPLNRNNDGLPAGAADSSTALRKDTKPEFLGSGDQIEVPSRDNQIFLGAMQNYCVRLSGLPSNSNVKDIQKCLKGMYAPPHNIKWQRDNDNTKTVYVKMSNGEDYHNVLKNQQLTLGSTQISVSKCPDEMFIKRFANDRRRFQGMGQSFDSFAINMSLCYMMKGLPFSAREYDVENFFWGLNIADFLITYDETGKATGTGFIEFATPTDFNLAHEKNGKRIHHRYIELFEVSPMEMEEAKYSAALVSKPMKHILRQNPVVASSVSCFDKRPLCIVLSGLPPAVRNTDVLDFFTECDIPPHAVHVMLNEDRRPNGRAFVEFLNPFDLDLALKQSGKMIRGNTFSAQQVLYEEMLNILDSNDAYHKYSHGKKREKASTDIPGLKSEKVPYIWEPPDDEEEESFPIHTGKRFPSNNYHMQRPFYDRPFMPVEFCDPMRDVREPFRFMEGQRSHFFGKPSRLEMEKERVNEMFSRRIPLDDRQPVGNFPTLPATLQHEFDRKVELLHDRNFRQQNDGQFLQVHHEELEPSQFGEHEGSFRQPDKFHWTNPSKQKQNLLEDAVKRNLRTLMSNTGEKTVEFKVKTQKLFEKGDINRAFADDEQERRLLRKLTPERQGNREKAVTMERGNTPQKYERRFLESSKVEHSPEVVVLENRGQKRQAAVDKSPDVILVEDRSKKLPFQSASDTRAGRKSQSRRRRRRNSKFTIDHRFSPGRQTSEETQPPPSCIGRTVQVSNVHPVCELDELLHFFRGYRLRGRDIIRRFADDGQPTGDIRITFLTELEAESAIKLLNFKELRGIPIHMFYV